MLIVGAKGFANEILEIIHQSENLENLAFYDDLNFYENKTLYGFPILNSEDQAIDYFKVKSPAFSLGIGNPILRFNMYNKFSSLGGELFSTISQRAIIGNYDIKIGKGCNILDSAIISNTSKIGMGSIIYYNVTITHDCEVGQFVELSPSVILLGKCKVGDFSRIGANSTVLPNVVIGKNVVIGAGSLVTKDVPDYCLAMGSPAKIIRSFTSS